MATTPRKPAKRSAPKPPAEPSAVQVNVDVDDFTFNELCDLEDLAGTDLATMFRPKVVRDGDGNAIDVDGLPTTDPKEFRWESRPSTRHVLCLITVMMRRTRGRQFSLEEAGDVRVSQVNIRAPRPRAQVTTPGT